MAEMKGQRLARLLGGGNTPLAQQQAMERLRSAREARMGQQMPQPAPRAPAAPAGDTFGGQMIMPGQGGYYTDTTGRNFVSTAGKMPRQGMMPARVADETGQFRPPQVIRPTMQPAGQVADETGQYAPPQVIRPTMQSAPIADETNQYRTPQAMTPTIQRAPMVSNAARSPFGRAMNGTTGKSNAAPPRPRTAASSGPSGTPSQVVY